MLYMGVDLGGTGIKAGVVSENGEILSKDPDDEGAPLSGHHSRHCGAL